MPAWCFQCGVNGTPEQAIGWDEDGEPACAMHCVKAKRPPHFEDVSRGSTHGLAPERVAEKSSPIIPAAPSPVQTSAKEKTMNDKRTCSCGCGGELRGRWPYLKGHNQTGGGATVSAPKKARKAKRDLDSICPSNSLPDAGLPDAGVCGQASAERLITLHLPGSKVQKLLNLLLAD